MNLLWRRRQLQDQEVCEPTLLLFALGASAFALLLGGVAMLMLFLPVLGHLGLASIIVCLLLAWLVMAMRRTPTVTQTPRQLWLVRGIAVARLVAFAILAVWLILIVRLAFAPGGTGTPRKADPTSIRVVTWNIHCGQDDGLPWKQFDWPARKLALKAALEVAQPEILCVQEATPVQVAFLEASLLNYQRVGGGRDGADAGEHCAIYFDRHRFELLADRTFWLEEPIDEPRVGSAFDVKRICTWVRLRDRTTGKTLRVYNTHLYLSEAQNLPAVQIILDQIAAGDPTDAIVLTADFNASPSAPSRRRFVDAQTGLRDSAEVMDRPTDVPTFQLYGIGVSCLDGILVNGRCRVREHRILDMKPNDIYPSDHFGVMADLSIH